MTSYKQLLANRKNAKKSTGPKTTISKYWSSHNNIKHGLTSKDLIVGEDRSVFESYRDDMLKKLNNKHKEITGADSPTYLAYQSLYNFELSLSSSSEDAIEEERNFYLEKIKQKRMLIDSLKRVKP